MKGFSIYLHIPFCLQRCPYCDFNTYAPGLIPEKEYLSGLLSELDLRAAEEQWKGRTIKTIYLGGGTPSVFAPASIALILAHIKSRFKLEKNSEITLEANPGTVTTETLSGFKEAGINRLSLGAQSFDESTLRFLGRAHSAEQTYLAIEAARAAEIDNLGLDLMYGVPGQTLESLEEDLKNYIAIKPKHLSAYGLTIEKNTPLFARFKKNEFTLPEEETLLEMFRKVNTFLPQHGFCHYEVSNFALKGFQARHNSGYWNGIDYLGLGAGAHSYVARYKDKRRVSARRWSNELLPEKYIERTCTSGRADAWAEELKEKDLKFEFFFLGLRQIEGVSLQEFKILFGEPAEKHFGKIIKKLAKEGHLLTDGETLKLSERGLEIADSVISNFA